jgi:hypothetical protein
VPGDAREGGDFFWITGTFIFTEYPGRAPAGVVEPILLRTGIGAMGDKKAHGLFLWTIGAVE